MKVTAKATRAGDWWAIEVPEVDGVFTQTKRLDQVEAMVRDAVSLLEDLPPESIEVDVQPEIDTVIEMGISLAKEARDEAEAFARKAREFTAFAATMLAESGFSLRDIGVVLGVSHQRVGQILDAADSELEVGLPHDIEEWSSSSECEWRPIESEDPVKDLLRAQRALQASTRVANAKAKSRQQVRTNDKVKGR